MSMYTCNLKIIMCNQMVTSEIGKLSEFWRDAGEIIS